MAHKRQIDSQRTKVLYPTHSAPWTASRPRMILIVSSLTFRVYWRLVLTGLTTQSIQRRLDDFGAWFNEHRSHSALGGLTPQEAWQGHVPPEAVPIRVRNQLRPQIEVHRRHYRGDPRLPVIEISVRLTA